VNVLTSSGDLLIANNNFNSDLLWACQGGGAGNFGVVTSLGFERLLPVDQVTLFRIFWPKEKLSDGFLAWQDWAINASPLISTVWGKGAREDTASSLGQFLGEPDKLKEWIKPVLKDAEVQIWQTSFIDAAKFFGGSGGPRSPVIFKTKSDIVAEKLTFNSISCFTKELAKVPEGAEGWVVFESYGGIMDTIPSNATAFPHRKGNLFCVEYSISWQDSKQSPQMLGWMKDFHQKVRPYFSGAVYANYCDLDLENWGHAYFGKNFERLQQIKKKYDGKNSFQYEQSIPPEKK
jgi:FAD/FMN-containing dehydrogenase